MAVFVTLKQVEDVEDVGWGQSDAELYLPTLPFAHIA